MAIAKREDIIKEKKVQMDSMISLLETAYDYDRRKMKEAFQKQALLGEPVEATVRQNREQFVSLFTPVLVNLAEYDGELWQVLEERVLK